MIGRILLGLVGIAAGIAMVMKTESLVGAFGRIDFFDRHLGTEGGTRLGYKLIGLLVIFISILIATNMIGGFMTWLLGPLLKFSQPPA
jgi:hypothetical protein